jgi:hypothetical protein
MKKNQSDMLSNGALFGLLLAGSSFLLTLLYWILDVNMSSIGTSIMLGLVSIGIVILFYWLSNKTLREKYLDGNLTFGQGFVNSLITGIVSLVVGSILSYILYKYIAPDYLAKIGEKVMEGLQSNPNIPAETIEKMQTKFADMTPENAIIKNLPAGLIMSVVISLIVSAFTKKKPDIFAVDYKIDEEK